MLPTDKLKLAIDIQAQSYKLLRWVADAIDKGFIPITHAHEYSNVSDAAHDWIEQHYLNFPPEARPEKQHFREFAHFFCTYVTTSFDVIDNPGVRLESRCGCYCDWCAYIAKAPHLQPKKLATGDKRRARNLMIDRVIALGLEEKISLSDEAAEQIADAKATRSAAGYSAYGYWLINRMSGHSDGKSILALWRIIAWNASGSPIKNFRLKHKNFVAAEDRLIKAMRSAAKDHRES